ncbi:MAG: hypothetical protein JO220_12910 [Hyphomicrobiales bacterium]|nr:hypothetical protein [Hyphomicrobiales bacterium]
MILIRSTDTKHVADFPQLLPRRNSQISPHLLYETCKQEPAKNKEGAMRVRVTTDGRLLGLDIGDWWTLIAGSTLAGLLAFFM